MSSLQEPSIALQDPHDLPCGVLALLDDGHIVANNRALREMLATDLDGLVGWHIDELLPPASRLLYHTYLFPQLKLHGHVEEIALPLRRADGYSIDTLVNASRVVGADGQAVVRCAIIRLREQRRLEDQLLHAKRAAEQLPGLLFHLRREPGGALRFHYASEALRTLFGVVPRDAAASANHVLSTIHADDIQAVLSALQQSADRLEPWHMEYRVNLPHGVQWRETHATPQLDSDGGISWHGYTFDATERKTMEAMRRDKEAAERASRAKSEFLARVSHELRTPLNGILGFAQILLMDPRSPLDDSQRRRALCIESAGQTLLGLINEVLDIARIEAGGVRVDMVDVDVGNVVREAAALIEPMATRRGVRVEVDVGDAGHARADPQRLTQVLINLLSNAIKYGPEGGLVRVYAAGEGPWMRLMVSDQGPGLSPEQQTQLFQPFNRLGAERTQTEGHGLGLVITRGLVELMGGRMLVNSSPGQGAVFGLLLRASSKVQTDPLAGSERLQPVLDDAADGLPEARVLYVEDNPMNAELMVSLFAMRPTYNLLVVDTACRALAVARDFQPDLLLLDMQLPDMDGRQLLQSLRQLLDEPAPDQPSWSRVPAVAVSADAVAEHVAQARAVGFTDYWTKPLDVPRLLPCLDGLLRTRLAAGGTMSV